MQGSLDKRPLQAEKQALSYEQHNTVQQGFGLQMIEKLQFSKGMRVLDLGCGTGNLTKMLSERVGLEGRIIAVDPDKERLQIARENYSASNIEYIEADDKTFPEGQYDLVFANTVIHWIQDKRALFEKVYKNLKIGGQFAFVTFDGVPKVHHKIVRRLFEELVSPDFFQELFGTKFLCLRSSEYESLASSLGFVKVSTEMTEHRDRWKNIDDCIDKWYSGLHKGAFNPEKFDKETLQQIKEEYGDGPIVYEESNRILLMILLKPGPNYHALTKR